MAKTFENLKHSSALSHRQFKSLSVEVQCSRKKVPASYQKCHYAVKISFVELKNSPYLGTKKHGETITADRMHDRHRVMVLPGFVSNGPLHVLQ